MRNKTHSTKSLHACLLHTCKYRATNYFVTFAAHPILKINQLVIINNH